MYASDLRTNPEGVFSAYSDLLYNAELLETTGPITFAQDYAWARTGDLSQAGVVDEAGAIYAGISNPPPNTSEQLILRIPMQTSQQDGFGFFKTTPADLVESESILLGQNFAVPFDQIEFSESGFIVGDGLSPDLTEDGALDCNDISLVTSSIDANTNNPQFDFNGDGLVDFLDQRSWLAEAGQFHLGAGAAYEGQLGFSVGDVSLDGIVDSTDLGRLLNNFNQTDVSWCEGDLTGDHRVDSRDLGLLLNDFGYDATRDLDVGAMSASVTTVPEPVRNHSLIWMLLFSLLGLRNRTARRSAAPTGPTAPLP